MDLSRLKNKAECLKLVEQARDRIEKEESVVELAMFIFYNREKQTYVLHSGITKERIVKICQKIIKDLGGEQFTQEKIDVQQDGTPDNKG